MDNNRIMLQIELLIDENGKVRDAVPIEGAAISITREDVKNSSPTIIKKSEGEILVKKIQDAMWERRITMAELTKKAKIGTTTIYRYWKTPGTIPLAALMRILRAAGIRQITLQTNGTYST